MSVQSGPLFIAPRSSGIGFESPLANKYTNSHSLSEATTIPQPLSASSFVATALPLPTSFSRHAGERTPGPVPQPNTLIGNAEERIPQHNSSNGHAGERTSSALFQPHNSNGYAVERIPSDAPLKHEPELSSRTSRFIVRRLNSHCFCPSFCLLVVLPSCRSYILTCLVVAHTLEFAFLFMRGDLPFFLLELDLLSPFV